MGAMLLNLSCPAVSQICSETSTAPTFTRFCRKLAPIVGVLLSGILPSIYRFDNELFPTSVSPITHTLISGLLILAQRSLIGLVAPNTPIKRKMADKLYQEELALRNL